MVIRPADHGIFAGQTPVIPAVEAAYFAGGSGTTTVDKFAFSDDSRTTLATGLSLASSGSSGAADSAVAGYVALGYSGAWLDTVVKLKFAGDSWSTLSTGLSSARRFGAGAANSGSFTYFAGGNTGTGSVPVSTVDKILFSSDSRSTLGTGLNNAVSSPGGFAQQGVRGYFLGGQGGWGGRVTDANTFAFSTGTRTVLGTGISAALDGVGGASSTDKGYTAGGFNGWAVVSTVDKFTFSSDTRSTLATGLSGAVRTNAMGAAKSGVAAYFAGGDGMSTYSIVDKFTFSTDARTTLGTGLSSNRSHPAGVANSGVL